MSRRIQGTERVGRRVIAYKITNEKDDIILTKYHTYTLYIFKGLAAGLTHIYYIPYSCMIGLLVFTAYELPFLIYIRIINHRSVLLNIKIGIKIVLGKYESGRKV